MLSALRGWGPKHQRDHVPQRRHLWLLWLRLRPPALYQADYFPLLPWFGVVLVGMSVGQVPYPDGRRSFELPSLGTYSVLQKTAWMGRYSLIIYLAHQPVLFAALTLACFYVGHK